MAKKKNQTRTAPAAKENRLEDAQSSVSPSLPVIGIGASAGGIDALKSFVPMIAADSGLVFVVVQHLSPDYESVLHKILARDSKIPVIEIGGPTPIEANHIYVIPPDASLRIADGQLNISPPAEQRGLRTPIDTFLLSLAEARGQNAACVILSGTGSDGTVGLRAIKEQGGLTIAQEGAEYDGMMRSAVSTGLVDFVMPVEEIPAKIVDYFRHLTEVDGRKGADGVLNEATDSLMQICALLRARTGHDFSGYKDKTVARRVQRRMQVLQIDNVPDFIERMRKDPQQLDALLQDLLIGVTNFFRDKKAFDALDKEVIPRLFEGKRPDDTVRVWVVGCSTGEEAYSLAILLREHMPRGHGAPKLQIFASDIDEEALQIARLGRYPASIAKDIPLKLLERYFVREDGTYRIASELREICLFSAHNFLRDAPFSKLDLISCRNLLIYLTPDLQNRIIPLFHYALNDGGYLFLGSSENVTRHPRMFANIDKNSRIFQRRAQMDMGLPQFPLTAPDHSGHKVALARRPLAEQDSVQAFAERQMLDRYAPAYVIIDENGDMLHASGRTGKYLELAPGAPKTDIFSMARRGLRPDLRAAVHKSASTGQVAIQSNIAVGTNGGRQTVDLIVQPLRGGNAADQLFLVVFQDVGGIKATGEHDGAETVDDVDGANTQHLEMELRAAKERLQTMTEELESSNEELKSGNEELSSMNEELQSANEELETSKEELQSINEELQTVNSELNSRVEELSRANSDIANLLESTQIATVFLDRHLAVKSFTPAAKDVFRLVESDTGRPITHVRARFNSDTVQEDAERVLRTLSTIERQVESNYNDSCFIMRMMPYRTVDNVIAGVVITFMDVTQVAAAEAKINELTDALRERVEGLESLLDLLPVGAFFMEDTDTGEVRINRYGSHLLGEHGESVKPRLLMGLVRIFKDGAEIGADAHPLQRASRGEPVKAFEGEMSLAGGMRIPILMAATPLFGDGGKARGAIATFIDLRQKAG